MASRPVPRERRFRGAEGGGRSREFVVLDFFCRGLQVDRHCFVHWRHTGRCTLRRSLVSSSRLGLFVLTVGLCVNSVTGAGALTFAPVIRCRAPGRRVRRGGSTLSPIARARSLVARTQSMFTPVRAPATSRARLLENNPCCRGVMTLACWTRCFPHRVSRNKGCPRIWPTDAPALALLS